MANKPVKDEPQELENFLGVDPIYQNYSDDRNKPFRAEEDPDHEGPQSNEEVLITEDVAYSHQEWTREDAGQDPATGEPLDISEKEVFDAKRDQYKDPNWGPNMPHAMTGKDEGATVETGSTEQVNPTGTTGEADKGTSPAVPTTPGDNK